MPIEFRGVSTASLGEMLKGYGVMAGVGAAWPQARFWWTPMGSLETESAELDDRNPETARKIVSDRIFELAEWASDRGKAFGRTRGNKKQQQQASDSPLEGQDTWDSLEAARALDAEGAGVFTGGFSCPNPVLGRWGQDGSGNLFNVLRAAGSEARRVDVDGAIFGGDAAPQRRLAKGSGVLFPEAIKRYATGSDWIHGKSGQKKPLGLWDFILAMRGLLILRGAVRAPRGSRSQYPAFPFVLPGSVVRAQGSPVPTDELFLPTWSSDHPRTLAEFRAQVRSFQARVGRRDFASGVADFRRAVVGRGTTGAFAAFHRFALEPRKPGRDKPQTQAVARGITMVGRAAAVRNSLRFLLAPLDDSRWLEAFRLQRTGGRVDDNSAKLALTRARFDDAIHAAIDVPEDTKHIAVLKTLWDLQLTLWSVSERSEGRVHFRPAPLLVGRAWGSMLSELLRQSTAARLGWALASLGWAAVPDGNGKEISKPIVEQLLPVVRDGQRRLRAADPPPGRRVPQPVPQPGRNPAREIAALLWRRWLDTEGLPALPTLGTRPADATDVTALLQGDVSVKELQQYFLAFLLLDGTGDAPPAPPVDRPAVPAYAALRLWFDLAAQGTPDDRRPLDGAVPRGVATGTESAVASACRAALRRLRIQGLPGDWPPDERPRGRSVARPEVGITSRQAGLMAAAVLVPVSRESVTRLAGTLLVPSNSREPESRSATETVHV